ncbi:Sigma-54 dependent DNA-binding response regulator [Dissulfuribacter thermophilus]|uniref:Sigma-54 dependent DNA-binding response regulator n=1 Tax=Dissulfuribacter thermophilus TaxID=1156395 RepID=A0A1B9F6U9_9BACT|nr:sigma-54 dependent transcriptional regulator [Dissulfuribacter thermophilus]OCC15501.1 Sigma-54 dependent DNA-binding response regulator [Dissulfuribacter thermophilus]
MRIIIVDDDPTACKILRRMLGTEYEVNIFYNGETAFKFFLQNGADIIITDIRMPMMDGLQLLTKAKEIDPEVIILVITGYSSVDSAVKAIKKGAYDYISKPFEPDDVLIRIKRAIKEKKLEAKVRSCQQERQLKFDKIQIITQNPKMMHMLEIIRKVAATDSTVLIYGETGVGKELVARMIHYWSPRKDYAFIPVNCSALSEGIMESELFGHEKGAFTGATNKHIGFFELANKGTILLDEIGTTNNRFQVKLLRVLQDKIIYRVGSTSAIPIDTRVLAATNQDLEREANENLFRPDLYYRLSVVTIKIPPLRERMDDVPLLANHFLKKYSHINPKVKGISKESKKILMEYPYPGNVRELENIIERAMILENSDMITPSSLMMTSKSTAQLENTSNSSLENSQPADEALRLEHVEKEHILKVLLMCNGRKLEAARLLGINKTTLWRKIKKYGLLNL